MTDGRLELGRATRSVKKKAAGNGGIAELLKELWNAAVTLRGSIEPADYKRYVLPLIFLRFLSLRYEKRRTELEKLIADTTSDYYGLSRVLNDPDEYRAAGAFIVPEAARWVSIVRMAQADDVKLRLDSVLTTLEDSYPDRLRGLLPRIYAGSNMSADNLRGLINLFSKDIFTFDHGGEDLIGRVYEYFIGEFANSEGKRGGEYFTPSAIVRLLVAMLEPTEGTVFDPCCGSGGMFVQSDVFTKHSGKLSFFGQESKDFTHRLCRMNLFIHGIDGKIELGNSYTDDKHAGHQFNYVLANPPFNDGAKGEDGWGADKVPNDDPRLRIGEQVLPLSPRNANTMWIRHFVHHLAPGGMAGFVMATGESATAEGARRATRGALIEANLVDCVVSLSGKLFSNTQIPCSLWFLSKARDGQNGTRPRRNEVLFIYARNLGRPVPGSKRQIYLADEEIERIACVYREYRRTGSPAAQPGWVRTALIEEIREHDYVLNPARYVGVADEDVGRSIFDEEFATLSSRVRECADGSESAYAEIGRVLHSIRASSQGIAANRIPVSKLIAEKKLYIGDGYRAKNSELSTTGLPFARASNVDAGFDFTDADRFPTVALKKVGAKVSSPGDVVFTSKGTVGRFAFVRDGTQPFVYSPQLCFWRSLDRDTVDPRYLCFWMQSRDFLDQVAAVKGQTDMADYVSLSDQRKMKISLPSIDEQRSIGKALDALARKIDSNRAENAVLQELCSTMLVDLLAGDATLDSDGIRTEGAIRA